MQHTSTPATAHFLREWSHTSTSDPPRQEAFWPEWQIPHDAELATAPPPRPPEGPEIVSPKLIDFPTKTINQENHEKEWFDVVDEADKENIVVVNEENSNETSEEEEEEEVYERNKEPGHESENPEEEISVDMNELRRARGRPRKIMAGLRGRVRKKYQLVSDISEPDQVEEFASLAEIPIYDAVNRPNSDEWIQAMATELKSIIKK